MGQRSPEGFGAVNRHWKIVQVVVLVVRFKRFLVAVSVRNFWVDDVDRRTCRKRIYLLKDICEL